jgi:hypothetical protein
VGGGSGVVVIAGDEIEILLRVLGGASAGGVSGEIRRVQGLMFGWGAQII